MKLDKSKKNCVFCKIISGEFPSTQIYQDESVIAFLDINPINPGHTLVVPREHSARLESLNPEIGGQMFKVGQQISLALLKSKISCEGINLHLSDGEVAGQEVGHTHLHIIPRFFQDGFGFKTRQGSVQASREELNKLADLIEANL